MKKSRFLVLGVMLIMCSLLKAQNTIYLNNAKHYSVELENKALAGDAVALNNLGSCYDRADGMALDRQKAFDCFQKSSSQGYMIGQYNLALYYEMGYVCEKDYGKAFELYLKSASQDFPPAQGKLGDFYYQGLGTNKDVRKALNWLNKAAEKNYTPTLFSLANIYEREADFQDYGKAFQFWMKLADLGYPVGECKVGEYYRDGTGVSRDISKAIEFLSRSAQKGSEWGQLSLSSCYLSQRQYEKATYWLTKAYEQGSLNACHNLADCYYYGNGVEQSYEKAFEIFQKGMTINPRCTYRVAVMYREGLGVKQDKEKAEKMLIEAAEKGIAQAQYLVGFDMYNGENTPQDYAGAVKFFNLALKDKYLLNDAKSEIMQKLSACYRFGRGVTADIEQANYWMNEAAKLGNPDAQKIQEFLHLKK